MVKPTILIVDDEENVVHSLSRTLRDQFHVLTATSGEAALEIIGREEIAVILTDQRMPGLTGVQLLERAKQTHPNTVGILISGYSDVTALVDALNLGIVRGYIPKPWDTEELRRKLNDAVRQFEAIFNDRELLHDSTAAVAHARTQLAELRKIFDLVSTREIGNLFSIAQGKPTSAPLTAQPLNREYLDHLSDGFALIAHDGNIVYQNDACRTFLDLDSLPATPFFSEPHITACPPLVKAVEEAMHGTPAHADFYLSDAQGNRSYLEAAATPIAERDGSYDAVLIVRNQTERQQSLAHLKGLNTVAEAIAQTLEFDQRLHLALLACCEAIEADGGFSYFLDSSSRTLQFEGAVGMSSETVEFLLQNPVPFGSGLIGQVAATGLSTANSRLFELEMAFPHQAEQEKIVSAALAPLRNPNGVSGVVGIFTRSLRKFSEADIRLLGSIGNQIGLALHNARLHQAIQDQAHTDSLTGLFNRRYFMELAEREYERARRQHTSLVVLMLDLDRFKQINDSYGHATGDHALQAVAAILKTGVRSIDLVCRYGGDEFAILLPDCLEPQAKQIVQRLTEGVQQVQISTKSGALVVGVCVGMATATLVEPESLESLLIRADSKMYVAKRERA